MKSYFVAALSFVGVLGTAGAAMAVNADTLGISGGTALTGASSSTLISTDRMSEGVGEKATSSPSPSVAGTKSSLTFETINGTSGGSGSGAASGAAKPAAAHNTGAVSTDGTTGGSAAPAAETSSTSAAKAKKTTTSGSTSSSPVHAVTGGSSSSSSSNTGTSPSKNKSTPGSAVSGSTKHEPRDDEQDHEDHEDVHDNGADD